MEVVGLGSLKRVSFGHIAGRQFYFGWLRWIRQLRHLKNNSQRADDVVIE